MNHMFSPSSFRPRDEQVRDFLLQLNSLASSTTRRVIRKKIKMHLFVCTRSMVKPSSATYPRFWRCHSISRRRCRISRGRRHISFRGCRYLLLEMHPHPERCTSPTRVAASPAGDTASPAGDTVASPKSWICDTAG